MYAAKIVASSNTIPTSYDATAGSLLVADLPSGKQIEIFSSCEAVIAVAFGVGGNTTIPVSSITTNPRQLYLPAAPSGASAGWVKDFFSMRQGDRIYIRSDSGSTITSGTVYINVW